jgi:spore coat protein CotF
MNNNLTDKEILLDVLNSIKSLAGLYHHFSVEASNDFVFDIASDLREEIFDEQRDYYNTLIQKGWYKVETQPTSKINQNLMKFESSKEDLDNYYLGE